MIENNIENKDNNKDLEKEKLLNLENDLSCIVCYDNFNEINPKCINPLECPCKFDIHEKCWTNWMEKKNVLLECPICHKKIEELEGENQVNVIIFRRVLEYRRPFFISHFILLLITLSFIIVSLFYLFFLVFRKIIY